MSKTDPTKRPYKFAVQLCDCREGDFRGWVGSFYTVDSDGWIRCAECGDVPDEIGQAVPEGFDISIDVRHQSTDGYIQEFEEWHYFMEGQRPE